jgi:RNA polymerase sigma-70 factor (ECF subfamily)
MDEHSIPEWLITLTGMFRKEEMDSDKHQWIQAAVERYERPLCRYAYRITGSIESARDAVQDTFLKLCHTDLPQDEDRTAAWLFRVCRNHCIDMIRKDNPMQPLHEKQAAVLPAKGRNPAEETHLRDCVSELLRKLAQLPANQAEVIRLKFQHHMSYREIAEVTALSQSNVGFLIHTGLKTLRQQQHPQL